MEIIADFEPTGEILRDTSWRDRRRASQRLAEAYQVLGDGDRALRCARCGTVLAFEECARGHHRRLVGGRFCHLRLCLTCAHMGSKRLLARVFAVLHRVAEDPRGGWVMLTLTQRNVPPQDLRAELSRVLAGWARLQRRREFRGVLGWFRVLEVTYNSEARTYHPHIHAILWVRASYWTREYVPHSQWCKAWKESLRLDYLPVVDVQKVRPRGNRLEARELGRVAAYVAKYVSKGSDVLKGLDLGDAQQVVDRVAVMDAALFRRRLVAWGGELRRIAREVEEARESVESHDASCPVCGGVLSFSVYRWMPSLGEYVSA